MKKLYYNETCRSAFKDHKILNLTPLHLLNLLCFVYLNLKRKLVHNCDIHNYDKIIYFCILRHNHTRIYHRKSHLNADIRPYHMLLSSVRCV